ncbi:S-protein homolog 5-like [Rhododendron vialii]|uniref:S-protein homolog 5-like n=1 Tax=Rhododendron vialii TaxID=182163 RepID=UPI00265E5218|nr:S-protein homolog 5-like [Rhododendron vialii]
MGQFHLSLVILTVYLISSPALGKSGVHIISGVPGALRVHCKSKDDDIGTHTLSNGEEFQWRFRPNIFRTTLFYCYFFWEEKQKSFAVYDARISRICKENTWNCDYYWLATPTVFNISADNKETWKTINYWN